MGTHGGIIGSGLVGGDGAGGGGGPSDITALAYNLAHISATGFQEARWSFSRGTPVGANTLVSATAAGGWLCDFRFIDPDFFNAGVDGAFTAGNTYRFSFDVSWVRSGTGTGAPMAQMSLDISGWGIGVQHTIPNPLEGQTYTLTLDMVATFITQNTPNTVVDCRTAFPQAGGEFTMTCTAMTVEDLGIVP